MRRTMLALGILLAFSSALSAEDAAAGRKARLVENVKSFTLTLQYQGAQDPKVPRWSMTLATHPIDRLAIPAFNTDVVISEAQALKIIDWLEKDGFLANAEQDAKVHWAAPCYVVQVAGGGHWLQQSLGWDLNMFKRMDALSAVLDGDASEAMRRQILVSLMGVRDSMTAADQIAKLKADLDHFALTVHYMGPEQAKPMYWATISTQAMEYTKRMAHGLDIIVTKEVALKIIDHLKEKRFFEASAELYRLGPGPHYFLSVAGGGLNLRELLGWGDGMVARLESLQAVLDPAGAETLGKLIGSVKDVLPPPVKATEGAQVAPIPKGAKPDAAAKLAAERAEKLKGDLGSFVLSLHYYGEQDKPYYWLTLSTHGLRRAASYQFEMVVTIDKAEASKIVDWLEKSGVLSWAWDLRGVEDATRKVDPGPRYAVYVNGAGMSLEGRLGWGKGLEAKLLGLRDALESESMRQMDVLLARLGIAPPSPAPERIAKVKENLKDFTFHLDYNGTVEKPFYTLTVSTKPDTRKDRYGMDRYALVDEKQALAIINRLVDDGFFRYAGARATADPNTPCYILRLDAGALHLEENLGWGQPLLKRLRLLKAVLDGAAAEGLQRLLARIGG